jgi:hypothetical protein
MKNLWIVCLFFMACGGSLSDEQRKKLREGMEKQQIVKVTDAEIVTAASEQGKSIFGELEKMGFDTTAIDALAKDHKVKIRWVVPGASNAREMEKQLIEAYVLGAATGAVQDNIQKIRSNPENETAYDSLLYSKPMMSRLPDGTDKLEGIWNIYLSKKEVVLSISASK